MVGTYFPLAFCDEGYVSLKKLFLLATMWFISLPLALFAGEEFFRNFIQTDEREILKRMSIEEKVGQIFIFGFTGTSLSIEYRSWIEAGRLGNVKIFSRNVQSRQQVRLLTDSVIALASGSSHGIPPFIATDLEGGRVNHVRFPGMPSIPSASKMEGELQCAETARVITVILQEMGINMNFAPCADVLTNQKNSVIGSRSYGENPEFVFEMVRVFVLEQVRVGILPTVKHFPGHGMTDFDSHFEAQSVHTSVRELKRVHLLPYRRLIRKRLLQGVMISHVTYDAIDPENPATFSKAVVERLLRRKMRFRGIIVTDDLEMESSEMHAGGIEQAFIRAFEAGNDLFLVAHSKKKQTLLLQRVPELFLNGALSEEELDRRVLRILRMKKRTLSRFYSFLQRHSLLSEQ
jgi:beta-N-acetylhexosaminidase